MADSAAMGLTGGPGAVQPTSIPLRRFALAARARAAHRWAVAGACVSHIVLWGRPWPGRVSPRRCGGGCEGASDGRVSPTQPALLPDGRTREMIQTLAPSRPRSPKYQERSSRLFTGRLRRRPWRRMKTTRLEKTAASAPDLLRRNLAATEPDHNWVADIAKSPPKREANRTPKPSGSTIMKSRSP